MTVEVYALLVDRQLKRWPEARQREACWMSATDAARSVKDPGLALLLLRLKEIVETPDTAGINPDDAGAGTQPRPPRG